MPEGKEKLNKAQGMFVARKEAILHAKKTEGWADGPFQTFLGEDKANKRRIRLNFRDVTIAKLEFYRARTPEEREASKPRRHSTWEVLEQCSYKELKHTKEGFAFKQ